MKIDLMNIKIKDLAGLVCQKLKDNGIDTVLTGGACVSIYSNNQYISGDLDFITYFNIKSVTPVLKTIGFLKKSSRHFENPKCPFFIEFLAPPVSIGNFPVKKFSTKKTKYGYLRLLTIEDSIKDRLAAYYHWNDSQSLDQAVLMSKKHKNSIDMKSIKKWSVSEKQIDKYKEFYSCLSR